MKKITIMILLGLSLFISQSCKEEPSEKIGENYFLTYDGSWGHAMITDTRGIVLIGSQIIAWNFDSTFIIVKQKPFDGIFDSILMEHPNTQLNYREKLYNECHLYNYWIIDKREEIDSYYDEKIRRRIYTGAVGGPYNYEKYWARRRELNVPDSLKLKEAERVSFPTPIHYLFYKWSNSPHEHDVE